MATIMVEGFIGGSGATKKYSGVAISPESLRGMAEEFKQKTHLNVEHDGRRRVAIEVLDADVRPAEDGSLGVWVMFQVDEEEWRKMGGRRAFSVGVVEPVLPADPTSKKPVVFIGYEPGRFDDATVDAAVAALRPYANVSTGRLYQFSEEVHLAKVMADLLFVTLQSIGASAIYDALKFFLRPGDGGYAAPTIFDIKVREETSAGKHTRVVEAYIETDDAEVLGRALTGLENAIAGGGDRLGFDAARQEWKELS